MLIVEPCKEELGGEKGISQFPNNKNSATLNAYLYLNDPKCTKLL